ncbi:MAG TPA: FHA domain-containing protein [Aggregatilineales bacterium]|nr:FHA domain-containing protein [Aggregatilineales bacterium]
MAHLIMRRGPEPGTIFRLNTPLITIGRGNRNTIIIHDNEVSREHVRLTLTDSGYEIQDMNSSNGTFINGQALDGGTWQLQTSCIIELGDSITLEFRPGEPGTDELRNPRSYVATFDDTQFLQSYLVYLGREEGAQPAVYPLNGMNITIGRSTGCNIVIIEPELSREHFRLSLVGRTYSISDLGSTNGTILNNELLEDTRPLKNGDIIQIGRSLRFQFTNTPERYTSDIITDQLVDETKIGPKAKRKTSEFDTLWMHPSKMHDTSNLVSLTNNILVSYARPDWDRVVAPLMNTLAEAGLPVWADQEWMEGTPEWETMTQQARLECPMMIIVLSAAALRNENVMKNWRHFHNRDKPIFLLISEPIDRMPAEATNLPKIQFNPAVPEMAFRQLATEINRLYGR